MCHRITPLLRPELEEALRELERSGRARLPRREAPEPVPDAYPGRQLPLFVLDGAGRLAVAELTWGFDVTVGGRRKVVFNTRIESALAQARSGHGMWAKAISEGRCLVPVRRFFESWTIAPPCRGAQVRFSLPHHPVFLIAGVCEGDRLSLVTTTPNASVGAWHSRMPLVLGPGESRIWLGADYAQLQDRSGIALLAEPEEEGEPTGQLSLSTAGAPDSD